MDKQKILLCTASSELDNFTRNFSKDFEITEEPNIKKLIDTIQTFNPNIIVLTEKYLASTKVDILMSYFKQIRFYSNARILYFTPRNYGDILIHTIITNYHVYDLFLGSNINTLEFKKSLYQGKLLKDVSHLILKDDQVKEINEPKEVVEVEKVVEKIVEIEKPVEVERIIEVEKIVEVEKPVEVERIVEKVVEIEKVIEKQASSRNKAIGFFSCTDNIGKTFLGCNIAYMLSKNMKIVLLSVDKSREAVFYFSSMVKSSPDINGIFESYKISPSLEVVCVRSNVTGLDIYEFSNDYSHKADIIIYDIAASNNIDVLKTCLSICDDSIFVCDTSIVNIHSLGKYINYLEKSNLKFKDKKSVLINEQYISQFLSKENVINIINQSSDIQFDNIYELNSFRPLSIECLYKGVPIVEFNSIVFKEFENLIREMHLKDEQVESRGRVVSNPVNNSYNERSYQGQVIENNNYERNYQERVIENNSYSNSTQEDRITQGGAPAYAEQAASRVSSPTFGQSSKELITRQETSANQPISVGSGIESKDKVEEEKNKMRKRFIYKIRSN